MKIYVAAKMEEAKRARTVMDALETDGHTITHDWTKGKPDGSLDDALNDLRGATDCDLLLLLNHPKGKGMFTEMGFAIAKGRMVVVVEPEKANNIFFKLPGVTMARSLAEAYERIRIRQCAVWGTSK